MARLNDEGRLSSMVLSVLRIDNTARVREQLRGPESGGGGEHDHRPEHRAEQSGQRLDLCS
jgi:hypothetical protein